MFARPRLITLDAYGTLYRPRVSVAKQYVDVALRNGVQISIDEVSLGFKRDINHKFPNYGKHCGILPKEWWFKVLRETFTPRELDDKTLTDLYEHFRTKEAFELFDDAVKFLKETRVPPPSGKDSPIELAVITNSDPTVKAVITSLGLNEYLHSDNMFVSYNTEWNKPEKEAFEAVMTSFKVSSYTEVWHIGDDMIKDFQGAFNAGCNSIYINRDSSLESMRSFISSPSDPQDIEVVEYEDMLIEKSRDKQNGPVKVGATSMNNIMKLFY